MVFSGWLGKWTYTSFPGYDPYGTVSMTIPTSNFHGYSFRAFASFNPNARRVGSFTETKSPTFTDHLQIVTLNFSRRAGLGIKYLYIPVLWKSAKNDARGFSNANV
jgi:hypothetical protein